MLSSLSCKVFAFTHLLFYYHKKQLNINRSLVEILFIHLQFLLSLFLKADFLCLCGSSFQNYWHPVFERFCFSFCAICGSIMIEMTCLYVNLINYSKYFVNQSQIYQKESASNSRDRVCADKSKSWQIDLRPIIRIS